MNIINFLHKFNKDLDLNYKRLDRDDYYMAIAHLVSMRSHDSQTHHGCVCVKDDRIVGTGYNGFLPGMPDDIVPNKRPSKYHFIQHAEKNLICNTDRDKLLGAKLYITGMPCLNCTKDLISVGLMDWVIGPVTYQESEEEKSIKEHLVYYYDIKVRKHDFKDIKIEKIKEDLNEIKK